MPADVLGKQYQDFSGPLVLVNLCIHNTKYIHNTEPT